MSSQAHPLTPKPWLKFKFSSYRPNSKTAKTESESESNNRAESGMEDQVSLKELTNIIRLFKDETGWHFESLQNYMSEIRIQLQHDIKEVRDNLSDETMPGPKCSQ